MSPCPKRITASTPSGVIVTLDGKKTNKMEHATEGGGAASRGATVVSIGAARVHKKGFVETFPNP